MILHNNSVADRFFGVTFTDNQIKAEYKESDETFIVTKISVLWLRMVRHITDLQYVMK